MKNQILTLFLLLNFIGFSQVNPETIEANPTVEASFSGGMNQFNIFLMKNLIYPQSAVENEISGKVYIQFKISEKGELSDFKILKGIQKCPECDVEAMRLLKLMPNWIPASLNNKNVSSFFTLPISFQLL